MTYFFLKNKKNNHWIKATLGITEQSFFEVHIRKKAYYLDVEFSWPWKCRNFKSVVLFVH
jgi:hypothetical protein